MTLTRRGKMVFGTLAALIFFMIGITTADWSYYELEGNHSISELGR